MLRRQLLQQRAHILLHLRVGGRRILKTSPKDQYAFFPKLHIFKPLISIRGDIQPNDTLITYIEGRERHSVVLHLRFADLKPILFTSEVYATSILNVDRSRAQGRQSQLRQGAK